MFFQVLRTYIDAKFHGESISDGFRAIRQRKVGEKLKKPEKIAKLDSQVNPPQNLSRSTPHPTVVLAPQGMVRLVQNTVMDDGCAPSP